MCQAFISNDANADHTRRNLQDYHKVRHKKASRTKTESRVNKIIHKMVEDGVSNQEIATYIKMAHALEDESEYDSEYSADS